VKGAIIISGGFREVGNLALEHELLAKARECEIRLIGPNCQGINYIPNKLCASWPLLTCGGSLAVISQSGTIAATMAGWAQEEGIGVSGVVSLGNQVDLCETDFILEFGADPKTHVIAVYLEGVKSGHRFLEQVAQILKPVIILKSGRTLGGQRAAASHTKSLAGSDDVFSGICQQIGVVRAQSLEELFDFSKGFARLPIPQGNRLMIITSSGGSGILAVDIAEEMGLCTPPLAPSLFLELKAADLPSAMVVGNPLDLTGDATAQDYLQILNIAEHYDAADMYLIIFGDPILGAAGILAETLINMKKPVGLCYLGGGQIQTDEVKKFHEKKLPVYPTPERAARSLGILYTQSLRKSYQKMDRVE
jgi:acyl-CoA synthetase (NDP forming)